MQDLRHTIENQTSHAIGPTQAIPAEPAKEPAEIPGLLDSLSGAASRQTELLGRLEARISSALLPPSPSDPPECLPETTTEVGGRLSQLLADVTAANEYIAALTLRCEL